MRKLPKVIKVKDIADAIEWSVQRTRRALKSLGVLHKRGRHYVTTRAELERAYPEMLEAMLEAVDEAA